MKNIFAIPNKPQTLPMKPFCKKDDYTWDDWKIEAKKKYPIRYFLTEDMPLWFAVKVKFPFDELTYWLKSHLVPWKRYHMLDLRQPTGGKKWFDKDQYRYGWLDADKKILYACFNILVNFIEKEHEGEFKEYIELQRSVGVPVKDLEEIQEIYNWWISDRKLKEKKYEDALHSWSILLDQTSNDEERDAIPELAEASTKMRALELELNQDETKMLVRLIQLREYLWS